MSYPIQRQSESYGVFADSDLRFAKEYRTQDLPEGLVNMLKGPRISAGLNNRRQADVDTSVAAGGAGGTGSSGYASTNGGALATGGDASTSGYASTNGALPGDGLSGGLTGFDPDTGSATQQQYGTQQVGNRRQAGDFDAQYDYSRPSISDLHAHDPHQMGHEEFDQEYPHGEPPVDEAFREQPQTPLQPLDEMLEHSYRPDMPAPHHDYLAQFRPHLASFTEARSQHTAEDGPAPGPLFTPMMFQPKAPSAASMMLGGEDGGSEKAFVNDHSAGPDWVTAAAVQPQVVPGWIGHGYAPGHRVGLPWREQVIPGTVTHLDGQQVGVRWDDGQHSSEEPSDLRPL